MVELIVNNNEVTIHNQTYLYVEYNIVDDYSVLLVLHGNNFNLVVGETIINGKVCETIEQIISNFENK